ncbi:MAG: hypothetical protein J3Q66DRAFT_129155 [Benniella sp.]|nr:MAG: hypothetical protein J3Q66DRAFT_129155 [Benniella sp.]
MNQAITNVHSAKGGNRNWSIIQTVSTSINTLRQIRDQMEKEFDVSYIGISHTTVAAEADVNQVQRSIRASKIPITNAERRLCLSRIFIRKV